MITDTKNKIISYINHKGQVRVHDLVKTFGISNVAVHKHVASLLKQGIVRKVGKPPLVFYAPADILDKSKIAKTCRDNDISYLAVFGSVARGEDREDSDIDLIARFSKKKSLLDLVRTENEFEKVFKRDVDLLTEPAISPYIKEMVKKDIKVIYGQ